MSRVATATELGFREQARRPLLLVLLVGLPFFFITRAIAATERLPRNIQLPDGATVATNMRDLHGASMATITIAFLVGLVGVFVMHSSAQGDRRLVVAGFRPLQVLVPRLLIMASAVVVVTAVSLAVTALSFTPQHWLAFAVGAIAVGLIYGLLGALAGAAFGRLGATYLILFAAMLDLGVAQNPMFGSGQPEGLAVALPGYGPGRVVIDASFASQFSAYPELALAFGWSFVLAIAVVVMLSQRQRTMAA